MKHYYLTLFTLALTAAAGAQAAPKKVMAAETALEKPVVLPATDVTRSGFTANWQTVAGADAYCVYVYAKDVIPSDGEYVIIAEDFSGITQGSIIEPVWEDEVYVDLDAYTSLPNWTVNGYASYVSGMVGGLVYSPYLDLRNNNGVYSVTLTYYASTGNRVEVWSYGEDGSREIQSYTCEALGENTFTLTFSNGWKATYFYIVAYTDNQNDPAYLDDVEVTQTLSTGDVVYTNVALNESSLYDDTTSWTLSSYDLRFASGITDLYYDVQAVAIGTGATVSYDYSPFSDMQYVDLSLGGVASRGADAASVSGQAGAISVASAKAVAADVFDAAGRLVASRLLSAGKSTISVAPGLYLVRLDGKTTKVIVK